MPFDNSFLVHPAEPACCEVPRIVDSLENPRMSLDDPRTWDDVLGGTTTEAGVRVTPMIAIGQPAIWRAICLISGDVAKLPFQPYERLGDNGKRKATNHPAYKLLRRKANPLMTAFNFRRTITFHALLHGNGCAAIIRDPMGAPSELLLLDPTETCLAVIEGMLWYITKIGDGLVAIQGDDVLHIMGLSHNGLWGLNVAEVFAEAFGLGVAARKFGSKFFGEGSQMSGVLMVPGHFSEEKIKFTMAAWNEMHRGLTNAHRVALLQDGSKFQPLTIAPETAQFLQTRQFEIREVANVFGVPPHKLGDDSRTSHNSLEQEDANYIDESLDPWLVQHETQGDVKLLTEREQQEESHFCEFNRNARLRTDATTRGEFYMKLFGTGGLSTNDILRLENMPTIGPIGDQRFRPGNFLPLDAPAQTAPGAPPQAQAALKACLVDRLDRLQRIEAKRWKPTWAEWGETFYASFETQIAEALDPLVLATWAVLAPGEEPVAVVAEFVGAYLAERKFALVDRSETCPLLDLAEWAERLLPEENP